jgi:hypothetical protein
VLKELGFNLLKSNNYIYFNKVIKFIIIIYINNLLIIFKSVFIIIKLKELLVNKFLIKELGLV